MEYSTQMEAARKGIITDEMKIVSEKEHISMDKLIGLMAEGKVIIPCNKNHKAISPNGLGSMLKTKINVNLGTSRAVSYTHLDVYKRQDKEGHTSFTIANATGEGTTTARHFTRRRRCTLSNGFSIR